MNPTNSILACAVVIVAGIGCGRDEKASHDTGASRQVQPVVSESTDTTTTTVINADERIAVAPVDVAVSQPDAGDLSNVGNSNKGKGKGKVGVPGQKQTQVPGQKPVHVPGQQIQIPGKSGQQLPFGGKYIVVRSQSQGQTGKNDKGYGSVAPATPIQGQIQQNKWETPCFPGGQTGKQKTLQFNQDKVFYAVKDCQTQQVEVQETHQYKMDKDQSSGKDSLCLVGQTGQIGCDPIQMQGQQLVIGKY